jgi:hypothetical protein
MLEKIAASMERMAAKQDELEKTIATLTQAKATETAPTPEPDKAEEKPNATQAAADPVPTALEVQLARLQRINDAGERALIQGRIESLYQEAREAKTFAGPWLNSYREMLKNVKAETLEKLEAANQTITETLKSMVQSAPQFPAHGFTVQKDVGERGFKNGIELIDHLVSDLPDDMPKDTMGLFQEADPENPNQPMIPHAFRTPRRQVKQVLMNIARHQDSHFDGPGSLRSLVLLSQGYSPNAVAEQVLYQTCADGTTAIGAGGAPSSALFIFPLVRRTYPKLIATEIASVQPMDRPDGKIFYLDTIRKDANGYTDEAGATVSNRMPIQRSDSFSDSYANDPGECEDTLFVQLRFSSKTVAAADQEGVRFLEHRGAAGPAGVPQPGRLAGVGRWAVPRDRAGVEPGGPERDAERGARGQPELRHHGSVRLYPEGMGRVPPALHRRGVGAGVQAAKR